MDRLLVVPLGVQRDHGGLVAPPAARVEPAARRAVARPKFEDAGLTDHHDDKRIATTPDALRRKLVSGGGLAAGVALAGVAAQEAGRGMVGGGTSTGPDTLDGHTMPEPSAAQSAGPVKPGRGSMPTGKVAVVTGAARGIGRAIAVGMAANGTDVVVIDIAGPVSPTSDAAPATPAGLDETVRQIKAYGRRSDAIRADIRDIAALRAAADQVEQGYGKIDIVVADAAIQRWMALLEMQEATGMTWSSPT